MYYLIEDKFILTKELFFMAIEVFNRTEAKFLINQNIYEILNEKLLKYMTPDKFNEKNGLYTISNIYYDTEDNHLIRTSLSKPDYKEKFRLRSYGIPKLEDKVFLEIKKKVNGIVNKRRTSMKLMTAYNFINNRIKPEIKPYMNAQVINEIAYMQKLNNLKPKLYLAYDRQAFFEKDNNSLRITFDTNIRTRRNELGLEIGDHGDLLLDNKTWLMEIKVEGSIPLWLSRLLSENKIYKTSFSKYGREYEKMLYLSVNSKGDTTKCLNQFLVQPQLAHQFQ